MDVEYIVENACARATVEFQKRVEEEFEKIVDDHWAYRRIEAIEKALPDMLRVALLVVLTEINAGSSEHVK